RRVPYVEDTATIHEVMTLAKETKAIVAFTLVVPELRNFLLEVASKENIQAIDIIGPMIDHMQTVIGKEPRNEPGLVHKLDEDYFRR
ncbi:kinase/pyrophosphorylase, partial [Planococcus sp. SIMBA_143]